MRAYVFAACVSVYLVMGATLPATGGEWAHFGLYGKTVNSIEVDPSNSDIVFAGAEEGLYRTTNGGTSWDTLEPGLLYGINAVSIDQSDPQVIYAVHGMGDYDDGVYRSTDGGDSWVVIYGLVYGTSFADRYSRLYAGALNDLGGGGVHLSTDGGATWDTINQGLSNLDVFSLGGTNCIGDSLDVDLAGTGGGIFRRLIYDTLWTWVGPSNNVFMLDFAGGDPHPHLFSACGGGSWSDGVYKSTDMGETWVAKYYYIYTDAVTVNPLNPQAVYAGILGAGVLRSTNGGETWDWMNQGLTDLDVKELAFSSTDTSWLYAGTEGGGVFRYGLLVGTEELVNCKFQTANCKLWQNFPNPFTHTTTIKLEVRSEKSKVSLKVYDLSGRLVKRLVDGGQSVTSYELPVAVRWDGTNEMGERVASGVYLYRLAVGELIVTKSMTVLR